MKTLKRIFLTLILIIVVVAVGVFANQKIQQRRMVNAVINDLLVIDQETHSWNLNTLTMELYIRNKSNCSINGMLVFLVKLSKKGLEKGYLKSYFRSSSDMIDKAIKNRLIELLELEIAKGTITGRDKALYDFYKRGKKLPKGMDYEPITLNDMKEDYFFKIRKYVSLDSGEIEIVKHEQEVPRTVEGLLYDIEIEGIEF